MKIERFEEIKAWQLARDLTKKVYSYHAGQTRAAIREFNNYLVSRSKRKK
jgi:hypothetical protein